MYQIRSQFIPRHGVITSDPRDGAGAGGIGRYNLGRVRTYSSMFSREAFHYPYCMQVYETRLHGS